MKTVVVIPGHPPLWVERHARAIATQFVEHGEVTVVLPRSHSSAHMLPGELAPGTLLAGAKNESAVRLGGTSAVLGPRRRVDLVVLVLWPGMRTPRAVASGLVARLRGEKLLVDVQEVPGHTPTRLRHLARRFLMMIASGVVTPRPDAAPSSHTHMSVVATCGADAQLGRAILGAFSGIADEVAADWSLDLYAQGSILGELTNGVRPGRSVRIHEGAIDSEIAQHASVLVAGHDSLGAPLVAGAVARGVPGVIVGHPVAGRVARRGDGVWLAMTDPSAILVAMESASGGRMNDPISLGHLGTGDEQVVSAARNLV